jgi:hypothetical protein
MFTMVALLVWKPDLVTRPNSAGMVLWRPKMQRKYTAVRMVRFNVLACLRTTPSALPIPSQAGVVVQRGERLRSKEIPSERNALGVHDEETGVTLRVKHQKS